MVTLGAIRVPKRALPFNIASLGALNVSIKIVKFLKAYFSNKAVLQTTSRERDPESLHS